MTKIIQEFQKELNIEASAAIAGISTTRAAFWSKLKNGFGLIVFLVILYFIGKNQVFPYFAKSYYKPIL